MYVCYHMCHVKSLHIYLLHRIYSIMIYLSVTQDILSRIAIHCKYVMLSMPYVTCISCHVIFTVTCYALLRNVIYYMVCYVTKCCLLHVCHVMKCCLLHLCFKVCHICRLTFRSRYATSRFLSFMSRLCHVHVTSRYEMSCLPIKLFMSITTLSARMG